MKIEKLTFVSLTSVCLIYDVKYSKTSGFFKKKTTEYETRVFINTRFDGTFGMDSKNYHTGNSVRFMDSMHLRDLIVNDYELTTPRNTIPHV